MRTEDSLIVSQKKIMKASNMDIKPNFGGLSKDELKVCRKLASMKIQDVEDISKANLKIT